jgi:hypothetical protein
MKNNQPNHTLLRRFSDPAALVLGALCLVALLGAWNYARSLPGIDYYVAWVAADATRKDSEHDIYTREGRFRLGREYRREALAGDPASRQAAAAEYVSYLHTSATPFLYTVIGLFSTGDYDRDLGLWHGMSLAAFTLALLLISRMLGFSAVASLALLLPCQVWLTALHSDLRVGNVNSFQFGLLALLFWLQSRDADTRFGPLAGRLAGASAGALAALMVLFKPNLAPIALVLLGAWLVRRQFLRLFIGVTGMALGALAALAWSSLFFADPGVWLDWVRSLEALMEVDAGAGVGNFNFANAIGLQLGRGGQLGLALFLCALALLALWWGRRKRVPTAAAAGVDGVDGERELIEYGQLLALACLIQLLVSPLVWLHYFVLAVPGLIVAFRPWSGALPRGFGSVLLHRVLPVLALLLLLQGPLAEVLAADPALAANRAAVIAVVILFGLGLWQLCFQDGRLPAAEAV